MMGDTMTPKEMALTRMFYLANYHIHVIELLNRYAFHVCEKALCLVGFVFLLLAQDSEQTWLYSRSDVGCCHKTDMTSHKKGLFIKATLLNSLFFVIQFFCFVNQFIHNKALSPH
jgi:hypothetical protein